MIINELDPSEILYCSVCGSRNVQMQAWCDANTHEYDCDVDGPRNEERCWCCDCEEHVRLAYRHELGDVTPKD